MASRIGARSNQHFDPSDFLFDLFPTFGGALLVSVVFPERFGLLSALVCLLSLALRGPLPVNRKRVDVVIGPASGE